MTLFPYTTLFRSDGINIYKDIEFYLTKKDIRNLIIKLNSKNQVVVSVPKKVNDETLLKFLNENLEKFNNYSKEKKEKESINLEEQWFFLFGEKHFFEIDYSNKKVIIYNKKISFSSKSIIEAVNSYRKKQLKIYLLVKQLQFQKLMNIEDHLVRVRDKTTAWATNHINKKIIYYSTNLSSFSHQIIDYVIIHELSHNIHPNHSKEFWSLISL